MSGVIEAPLSGQVTTTTRVNLRKGSPDTSAPVVRKLDAGTVVQVVGLAVGEAVQGNAHWYHTSDDAYIWAGGCGPLQIDSTGVAGAASNGDVASNLNQPPMVVDISHGDGVSDFNAAAAAGLKGVIHKATTGATGMDDAYKRRRLAAADAGLLWGAYHWGTAAPIADQVKNFLDWATPDAKTLIALDFEADPDNQMTLDGAKAFSDQIFASLNRRPVIYSGITLKNALGSTADPFWTEHRLWLAQYGSNPKVQASWSKYWLWQYTDGQYGPGIKTIAGIPGDSQGRLDCDFYAGTPGELETEWAS